MRNEFEQKLKQEFDPWFEGLYSDPGKTCLAFGIECSDGWFDLIYELCKKIKAANPPAEFRVAQVKEKGGGLRFYVEGKSSEEINRLIGIAEQLSTVTCAYCGSTEEVETEGAWGSPKCSPCRIRKGK